MESWLPRNILWPLFVLFAVYFPLAGYLKHTYVPEQAQDSNNSARFKPWPRSNPWTKAYVFEIPEHDQLADSAENGSRSPLIVYENDKPLGPAHSKHDSIVKDGHGRYSHWKGLGLVFSTSDNSDPNSNGNSYTVRMAESHFARFKPWPQSNPATKAYVFEVPEYGQLADSSENWTRSPLVVYENDKPLGPPHSGHESIVNDGQGRYSHWKGAGVIFSTSDNSDPNSNGNRYTVRMAESHSPRFKPWPESSPGTNAYVFQVPEYDQLADSSENESRSPLIIYENDKPLGPPHSKHQSIVKDGHGRYSHWTGSGVIFSTSDNSDPNSNGNSYTVRTGER